MYQTARNFVENGNNSGLSNVDKNRKADHSADARNEMHFQPQVMNTMNADFVANSQQSMMGMTGGLKVQDLIRMGKADA